MTDKRRIAIAAPATGAEEWEALREPLESGWLTQGLKVKAFEEAFAARHRVAHALATTSCTTALHLALAALGIGPGDEVIVPAFTWVATANAVIYCRATPVFVDVCPDTYNIDPVRARAAVTERTRAAIPVHLFGLAADMDGLRAALPAGVRIVEDAACAAGGAYNGVPTGGLADVGVFSFHPRKSITTGEGGMLTTNDAELAARAEVLRNHGASVPEEVRHSVAKPYLMPDFDVLGFNYRMSDLQGAVGLVQLGKLDRFVTERRNWAAYYTRELGCISWLRPPAVPDGCDHAWQAYVCAVDPACAPLSRDALLEALEREGIGGRPGTHAVHMLGYYRARFGLHPEDFPVARSCARDTLALPLHNRMTPEDYSYVVAALRAIG